MTGSDPTPAAVPRAADDAAEVPFTIPDPRRRRTAAVIYLVGAALAGAGVAAGLPRGLLAAAGLGVVLAAWHLLAAHPIRVDDSKALAAANREVEFAVGHASATLGFDGWRARPVWNVLVFAADDPPSQRGLVRVDAGDGRVIGSYFEDDPGADPDGRYST